MTIRVGLVVALLSVVGACGGSSNRNDGAGGRADGGDDGSGQAGASGRGGSAGVAGSGGSAGVAGGGGGAGVAGGGGSAVGGATAGAAGTSAGGRGGTGGVAGAAGSGGASGGAGGGGRGGSVDTNRSGSGGGAGVGGGGNGGSAVGGGSGAGGTGGSAGTGVGVGGRGGAAGSSAGTGGGAGSGGGAGGGLAECAPRLLLAGTQSLIAYFVVDEGVIAALDDRVVLVDRNAQIIKSVPFARQITAAAFDGMTLVIADQAALTVLTRMLDIGPSVFVTETCASGVLVSGKRFVCGPANDWNRIFYTYDMGAAPPVQIGVSSPYTYNGTPMRRVPGTDDFITVTTNLSPSDFHLYHVDSTGKAVYINESPYHGDFAATTTYAYDGSPAAHLIQSAGLMLKIYGDGCNSTMNSFNTGCFIKDGVLGTLRTGESYVGLADDAAGTVFGVVAAGNTFDAPCKTGCAFERIDVATHTITSQKQHPFTSSYYFPLMTAPDPRCANIVLGMATSTDPFATTTGFRIESFDY
jgi:hypothetical protein